MVRYLKTHNTVTIRSNLVYGLSTEDVASDTY